MNLKTFFISALLVLTCVNPECFAGPSQEISKRRMMNDLDFLKNTFEVKYAPLQWKEYYINLDLDAVFAKAKAKVAQAPSISIKDFQHLLLQVFNEIADYHVGISFYSTESAVLPISIKSSLDEFCQRRYFITHIDWETTSYIQFPFEVGDEIIFWNNQPIDQVVQELKMYELGGKNTPETDQALAEILLTKREGIKGVMVPSGMVRLAIKKKGRKSLNETSLYWSYHPEQVKDIAGITRSLTGSVQVPKKNKTPAPSIKDSSWLKKSMMTAHWHKSSFQLDNGHHLGAFKSFLPNLGRVVWRPQSDIGFDAYIFETTYGKQVGYVRIPHYMASYQEVGEFAELIRYFEANTEALIIDQHNNPGGAVFYLYALLSLLTDYPMEVPKHRIALTQEEIYSIVNTLSELESMKTDFDAQTFLSDVLEGYPVSERDVNKMKTFFRDVLAEWGKGNIYTDPLPIMGIDYIQPHPQGGYSKPILLLINELDFSGGDFFPAILQDNERAIILGTRTAGAGGYVLNTQYPNQNGILEFTLTASLAEREGHQPLENLGVTPDIEYSLTVDDLQNNYRGYVYTILDALDRMLAYS